MEVVRKGRSVILNIAKICTRENTLVINSQVCRCFASGPSNLKRGDESKSNTRQVSELGNAGRPKAEKISFAMKAYLERAKAHDDFMQSELQQYEIGKRHLANIMSLDADAMTQDDVDKAIEYLLPSGLFDKKARPKMKHPEDYIPIRKAAQFNPEGRPFHSMFYTGTPNYYQKMHHFATLLSTLNDIEDTILAKNPEAKPIMSFSLAGTRFLNNVELNEMLNESISQKEHEKFNMLLARLAEHPYAARIKEDILAHTKEVFELANLEDVRPMQYDENGRPYQYSRGRRKRSAMCLAIVRGRGTGLVDINGKDLIGFFPRIVDREQIMFPLQFTGMLQEVDIEVKVKGEGESAMAGAIRLALAKCLRSFVDREMMEKMRIAGLLTKDVRVRERKKVGQRKARKKMTWKKR